MQKKIILRDKFNMINSRKTNWKMIVKATKNNGENVYPYNAVIDFRHLNLTSLDVLF